jgi:hypothetical protein
MPMAAKPTWRPPSPLVVYDRPGNRSTADSVSWFSDSFHSSFRESAWSVGAGSERGDPSERRQQAADKNPRKAQADFASSLRGGGSSSPSRRRTSTPSARRSRPTTSAGGVGRSSSSSVSSVSSSSVSSTSSSRGHSGTSGGGGSTAVVVADAPPARSSSTPKRRPPKVVDVATPATPRERPPWNVCSFKGEIGRLHVSQRAKASMSTRWESEREEGEEYF